MDKHRIEYFRNQANCTLELTKGFTPEQSDNSIKALGDLAGMVLELTQFITENHINPHQS